LLRFDVHSTKENVMTRVSTTVALLAVAALAGCATYRVTPPAAQAPVTSSSGAPVLSSSGPVTSAAPNTAARPGLRLGYGVVEAISLVNPPSASTGGGPAVASAPYRLTVRMDDNSVQWMDVTDRDYRVGDRLQITPDNRIMKM
jgi:hypothetical protein